VGTRSVIILGTASKERQLIWLRLCCTSRVREHRKKCSKSKNKEKNEKFSLQPERASSLILTGKERRNEKKTAVCFSIRWTIISERIEYGSRLLHIKTRVKSEGEKISIWGLNKDCSARECVN
jgi:hypothetical protein